MADEQMPVGLEMPAKSSDDPAARLKVEIYHHIATEDDVHRSGDLPIRCDEVDVFERDAFAQFRDYTEPSGLGAVSVESIFLPQCGWNGLAQVVGIHRLAGDP